MCDTLVSLTDGGVLFAKNSGRDPNEAQSIGWYPASDHAPGRRLRVTWSVIEQVEHTHAVMVSQPWWMWGAEMGTNEHGLVIGNQAVFTRRRGKAPASGSELLGMDLVRLGLERASTRREAVQVIVDLLERHGQGGPCSHERPRVTYDNSFLISDPQGAVLLETAGRHWAVEEVSGPGRSISHGLTIRGFAERFQDRLRTRMTAAIERRNRTTVAACGATSAGDLMAALRDHGHGRTGPEFSVATGAMSAPCAHAGGLVASTQTTASWVSDLTGPEPTHWVTAAAAPCTALFRPADLTTPLPEGRAGNTYDEASTWWRHERLHRSLARDYERLLSTYVEERDALERQWLADPPEPTQAWAQADRLDRYWADLVTATPGRDTRPGWLRARWRRWNAAAGL